MNLFEAVVLYLSTEYHPGKSKWSKEPCDDGVYSSFFQTTVCQESRATAIGRYERKTRAAMRIVEELLCKDSDNKKIEGCTPYINKKNAPKWTFGELLILGFAVSGPESGYREDVDNGRGFAKDCTPHRTTECGEDDVGGRGRGPAREACAMQIHPDSVGRFSDYTLEDLLGTTEEAYERCYRVGFRMLLKTRAYCDWNTRVNMPSDFQRFPGDWVYQTVSLYGTGTDCYFYGGKTAVRVAAFNKMYPAVKNKLRKKQ